MSNKNQTNNVPTDSTPTITIPNPYNLTTNQIQTAIKRYIDRKEYMKIRNQRPDEIDRRKDYNKKRYNETKELLKFAREMKRDM